MIVCAAAAILLSTVLSYIADTWFGDNESVAGVGHQIVHEACRSQALRERSEMVARSMSAKCDIIDRLLAGRMRLQEAIVQFHEANQLIPNVDRDLIPPYRRPGDPEGVARQVLRWARNGVAAWPSDKAHRLLVALDSDYQTLFGSRRSLDWHSSGRPEPNAAAW